ncbi:MAG TPA: hypothetical protein VMW43_12070 [Bacteroidota bacterium]|nr:hypothetical protein [Bacteroidota bacterium]
MDRTDLHSLNKSSLFSSFIIFCVLLIILFSESCYDNSPLTGPTIVNISHGQGVRPGTPTSTNAHDAYAFSVNATSITMQYQDSLNFDTNTVSYSIIVTGYNEGYGIISLIDTGGKQMLRDSIISDTVLANSNLIGYIPKKFALNLTKFSGRIIIEVTKKDYGMTPTIFGLWNWLYTGGIGEVTPATLGFHALLNLSEDYKWSIIVGDTIAFQGTFSLDYANSTMSWYGDILTNPVAAIFGNNRTFAFEFFYPDELSMWGWGTTDYYGYFSRVKFLGNGVKISQPSH